MVLGLKPMGKASTEEKSKVLDRTKALHGARTQACGETNYLKEKLRYMDFKSIRGELPTNSWVNP